ncbi:MAG: hypothetical protein GC162_16920 [Planctomycetes bacterium]|nr:hypothetical protein [Planctomycetota bacterium]
MSIVTLHLAENRTAFAPGQTIAGRIEWRLDQPADAIELRLVWHTAGKGTRDAAIAQTHRIERPGSVSSEAFEMTAPNGPYSFSGKLISILWAMEAVIEPSESSTRIDLVIAPGGREVVASDTKDGD